MNDPRIIMVQLSMSNDKRIPNYVPERDQETWTESLNRRTFRTDGPSSVQLVKSGDDERYSFENLLDQLADAGYYMVSVWRQERKDPKGRRDPRGNGRTYHTLRYTFAKGEEAEQRLGELQDEYPSVEEDFISRMNDVFWRANVFQNYRGHGESMISVNLGAAVDRLDQNGDERLVWDRDDAGEKVGDAPKPIQPHGRVVIDTNLNVSLV